MEKSTTEEYERREVKGKEWLKRTTATVAHSSDSVDKDENIPLGSFVKLFLDITLHKIAIRKEHTG